MKGSIAKEPVIAGMLARLLVGWASAKGFEIPVDGVLAIMTGIELVLTFFVRGAVEPKARLRKSQVPPPG